MTSNVSNEERVIKEKLKQLSEMVEERELLQERIAKTAAAISAFIELLENEDAQEFYRSKLAAASKPVGLTESIKRILQARPDHWHSPSAIRALLETDGFPLSGYNNALGVIYTTLGRLVDQELVEYGQDQLTDNKIYRWKESRTDADLMGQTNRGLNSLTLMRDLLSKKK